MLSKLTICCVSLLGLMILAPSAQAQRRDYHPPYVDQHFAPDHTPRYDYGTATTHSNYYPNRGCSSGTCGDGTCSDGSCNVDGGGNGGSDSIGTRGPKCPPVTTASLTLWVPEHCEVCINGYPTKIQTLGGVHSGSRIFTLDGLDGEPYDHHCKIKVIDYGKVYERTIPVAAGGEFKVRYPYEFNFVPPVVPSVDMSDAPDSTMVPHIEMSTTPYSVVPSADMTDVPDWTVVPSVEMSTAPDSDVVPSAEMLTAPDAELVPSVEMLPAPNSKAVPSVDMNDALNSTDVPSR